MKIDDVRRVMVLGAGTMGRQIALQCAAHGYEVVLFDTDGETLSAAVDQIDGYGHKLLAAGAIAEQQLAAALARISATGDREAAAGGADLVSEAIPEDPDLKGRVLGELNAVCPERTIFMTNTSTLLPSQFAAATGRPDRVIALHFHLPVWISNLADVMPHAGTAPAVTELVTEFARRIGQVPIVLHREHNGYVFNAMLAALHREAITMAQQGVASIEDIDRSWMHVMKSSLGPFGVLDAVGLDTAWSITDYWARRLPEDRQGRLNADFLRAYVDRGEFGVKSLKGFYSYPDPAFARPGFTTGELVAGDGS